jgi:putative MATE family efflux protein
MKKENDLGRDPVGRLVLRLAIPTMIAQFVNILYSIIDRMYIGNIPKIGDLALAGVGICGPIVTLLSSFGTLVGLGGSILMAMRQGEGNVKRARQLMSNSFFMLIGFSAVLTISFLLLKEKLLMWFGASEVTFEYANTYMTIYTVGTFFALMSIGLNYFITCQGFATIGMATVLTGAITNIILDPVFIFIFDMGVAGAAVATVIAQMASCMFAIVFLSRKKVPIGICFGNYSGKTMLKIIAVGFSPFMILATDSVIILVTNAVLQKYGGAGQGDLLISGATIVQSYMMLITGPLLGISGGTQAILSYNFGARQIQRVKKAEWHILKMGIIFTAAMFLLTQIAAPYFVMIFTRQGELTQLAIWGIRVYTIGAIPLSFQYVLVDGLTALGRTKTALCLSLFRKIGYVILTFVFPAIMTAKAAFYAEPVMDVLSALMSTVIYLLVIGKHLQKRENATTFACQQ